MKLKEMIYQCLDDNFPHLKKEREEDLERWRAWSCDPDKKIVVFGASAMCEICIRHLSTLGIQVDVICDNDSGRFGEFVMDSGRSISVVSVDEAMSDPAEKICFAAVGAQHFSAVSAQLKQYELSEDVLKWHLDFYLETVIMFCAQPVPFMDRVAQLLDFYEDEESLEILWCHFSMLFELSNVPETLNRLSMEDLCVRPQYFLEDGKYLGKQDVMVDCGAYTGDTLEDLLCKINYQDFERYDCFELFPTTYEKLRHAVDKLPDTIQNKVRTINMGVGEINGAVLASNGSATKENSTILHNGNTTVNIVRLNDIYRDENVTFIKMDIEGSEQAALRGGKNVIARCHPMCAICIYHSFSAFWEVPQILKEYVPEYRMILRHHTTYWDDTVCYAKIGVWD